MIADPDIATMLRSLIGEGPVREIQLQSDDDRVALNAETQGSPLLDIETYSAGGTTPFINYVNTDILHTLQQPRGDDPEELIFIHMAHVMELMFKLMNLQLLYAQDAIRQDKVAGAIVFLRRTHAVMEYLAKSWSVVSTITPQGYVGFRDSLGVGSGFESYMYRRLEFIMGNKQPKMLQPHRHVPAVYQTLSDALAAPSIYDDVIALLKRRGFAIDDAAIDRDLREPYVANASVQAAWLKIYREEDRASELCQLAEALIELGDRFKVWRYRHFVSVERLIGFKPGTGGSGIGWLRMILDHNFFPELWDVRTEL